MITLEEYRANSRELHQAYYLEVALAAGLKKIHLPCTLDEVRAALAAGDEHLNTISLARWDAASRLVHAQCRPTLKARGEVNHTEYYGVCPLKALARHLVEESQER